MKKHFPRVLTQKTIENRKELPHAILAITLAQILLKFHLPLIYQTFLNHEIPLSMVVTQEILTVFAKYLLPHAETWTSRWSTRSSTSS